jgi:Lipocalin-like domain
MQDRVSRGLHTMTIKARGIAAFVSSVIILSLASIGATSFAQAPAKSIKDQLVGHWQLVSVGMNNTQPYGNNPQGVMFLDADGHFSTIVLSAGDAKNIAYYGTYIVNDADNTMTIHIDGTSRGNAEGHNQKRVISLNGDQLTLTTPNGAVKLTWKRS